jgi:ABC-type glycerol-3-phosphate transport system permease component
MRAKAGVSLNLSKVILYLVLTLFAVFTVIPFYWTLTSSFKPRNEIFDRPTLINQNLTLRNYRELLTKTEFPRWVFNSLFVAVIYTVMVLFFCSLGGFAFAKYEFAGKGVLFFIVLSSMTIPIWAIILPLFIWFSKLKLMDTYLAIILPGSANAFGIFLMRQYIHGIPSELLDSARIDGCGEFKIYYQIVLPVIKPAVGALAIFAFLHSWNAFLLPLLFLRSPGMLTVPVGVSQFVGQKTFEYGWLMSGSMISIIPMLFIFLAMQKQLVAGLTFGAVKG